LCADKWEYGYIPYYIEPQKPDDEQYTYTFSGWVPEIVAVNGDATYTATYTKAPKTYLITFLDDNGSTLCSNEWEYGATPTCETPTKPDDEQYTYTFSGWVPEIVTVTGDATYTASYTATSKPEGITNIQGDTTAPQKVLHNSQLYILRNGEIFNAQGARVE